MQQRNIKQIKKHTLSTNRYGSFMPVGIIVFSNDKKNILTRLCKQRTSE